MTKLKSAAGVLALLNDPDGRVQSRALEMLLPIVDLFWAEIAESVDVIEGLSEEEDFGKRELAAAVASKCFYHLEDYDEALRLALGAGSFFDASENNSEYVEKMLAMCVEQYIAERRKDGEGAEIDENLVAIVDSMFQRCIKDGSMKRALGIALESRRIDIIEECLLKNSTAAQTRSMLQYAFDVCRSLVTDRAFRRKVLETIVSVHMKAEERDHIGLSHCLQALDKPTDVADMLQGLLTSGDEKQHLLAYQVAFDLCENENQQFLINVDASLKEVEDGDDALSKRIASLHSILVGGLSVDLYLDFLYRNNRADLILLKKIKDALPERNSSLHEATVICHAYMHCGTTIDTFLRENLQWLSKASNWAKFNAIASMGVVHKGHLKESMKILELYLPKPGMTASHFQEGGALYALGLIHANKGGKGDAEVTTYLRDAMITASNNQNEKAREVIQHGAILGLGLATMATNDSGLYETLLQTLYGDSAIAGEAVAIAMGLLTLGSGNGMAIEQMLQYARETKHEKIIRGLALAVSLTMFGQEQSADTLIETMTRDKDAILRSGGMWTIAMAYAGTNNNSAIRRLLHVAVSDVNDEVRRTSVMALGFVMFRTPEQVPSLVSLLAESYNPHVRYGAVMAIGVACAGNPSKQALDIVLPMLDDRVDFVVQGALMSLALMLMEQNDKAKSSPFSAQAKLLREKIMEMAGDKLVSVAAKWGAVLAAGILDAGGRNMCVALLSRTGFVRRAAVVGMAVWLHHWFWYPLSHFLGLALTPTAVIGVNKDMMIPDKFTMRCNAKPSTFAYQEALPEEKGEEKKRVETAVLSTTAKAKAKARAKAGGASEKQKDGAASMDTAADDDAKPKDDKEDKASKTDAAEEKKKNAEEVPEPDFFDLQNPCRVTYAQQQHIEFPKDQRYRPVYSIRKRNLGVLVLTDSTPDEPDETLREIKAPPLAGEEGEEPEAPEPFEWVPPEHRQA